MTTLNVFEKDPNDIRDFLINWTADVPSGSSISSSDWVLEAGIEEETGNRVQTSTSTGIRLKSGTADEEYRVSNDVVFANGEKDRRSIHIRVVEQ